ncbi:MAG: ATP-dependent DNA helicase RecG, partial [Chthonomonas sp.]|nr:ATP-dependent DNA helicase RecG [Chthonomonas sp.]
ELLDEGEENENFTRIVPVYPLSEGLPQWVVRRAAQAAVEKYLEFVPETLSDAILKEHGLKRIHWALRQIHMPDSEEDQKAARKRLVFDEFFRLQLALAVRRGQVHAEVGIAFPLDEHPEVIQDLKKLIPFELTGAQDRVIHEILRDMREPHPMNRLVQGDVGAGKTLVAAAAMLACVRCGYQAVLMAPTEILAEQHTANLRRLFEPLLIPVVSLVGRMTKTEKAKSRAKLESGQPMIAVGTHALIQDEVRLPKLGLAVIDEQHRFGVMQRASLRGKGFGNPDVLVMTATPIPRTLAMALYGDLDISVIDELPPNRKPIKTHFKPPDQRESTYESAGQLLRQGAQAYVVCPLVGESEKMLAQAATELHDQLTGGQYHDLRVGLLHGQLKSKEKDAVMEAFRAHQLDVLVATTVIEVGVDVPNATIMIIEDAHRFGLSQLHQLRGRIGRGGKQSYCVLIGDARTDEAKARMDIMVATSDGFRIADEDLKIRGPGDMLGTRQSGALGLHVADLIKDARMLEVARTAAQDLLRQDPTLSRPEHRALKDVLRKQTADLASIALS